MRATRFIKLALDEGLPTEFRLFQRGWNETENGRFLFDDVAAASVMAAYKAWGIDLMIDLEHQSLDVQPGAPDPTARDARGWCGLELRGGDLWAVGATWTPDGAARLQNKTQRYVSPAFETDPKTNRVLKMINIAITAIPATHNTPALVAASLKRPKRMNKVKLTAAIKLAAAGGLDPSLVKKALDAVEAGDLDAAMQILKSLIAVAAGADPDPDAAGDPGSEGDSADPPTTDNAVPPKAPAPAAADDSAADDDPAKKTEQKAMRAMLCRLAGKVTFAEAVAEAEVWRTSHLTLESERAKLAKERETLENAERRTLAIALVTIGAEFPATVWADDKATALKPRWLKMPIDELRQHLADQKKSRGVKAAPTTQLKPALAPAEGSDPTDADIDAQVAALTPQERKICATQKCDPKEFVRLRMFRDGKRTGT